MGKKSTAAEIATSDTELLYREHGRRLWQAILGFVGDRDLADDIVAEAFAQLLRRGSAVRNPAAWVWRTAFAVAGGQLAIRRGNQPLTSEPTIHDPELPWDLLELLGQLSHQQRAVVILRDCMGHSARETADILDSTEQSVRSQLSRAHRTLRDQLDQREELDA